MTSNTAPSPLVASASSSASGSLLPWHAFDGSTADANAWVPNTGAPAWLQIDFGSGNAIAPLTAKIAPDSGVNSPNFIWPYDFTIAGSDTGAFTGEQELRLTGSAVDTGWTANTLRTFTLT